MSEIESFMTRNVGRILFRIANIVSQLPTLEVLNLSVIVFEMSPKIEIVHRFQIYVV